MSAKQKSKIRCDRYYNPVRKCNTYIPYIQKGNRKILFSNEDGHTMICNSLASVKSFIKLADEFFNEMKEAENAAYNNPKS